jgi:hypothetical protein
MGIFNQIFCFLNRIESKSNRTLAESNRDLILPITVFIRLHVAGLPGNTMGEKKSTVELLSRVHDDYWITGCTPAGFFSDCSGSGGGGISSTRRKSNLQPVPSKPSCVFMRVPLRAANVPPEVSRSSTMQWFVRVPLPATSRVRVRWG